MSSVRGAEKLGMVSAACFSAARSHSDRACLMALPLRLSDGRTATDKLSLTNLQSISYPFQTPSSLHWFPSALRISIPETLTQLAQIVGIGNLLPSDKTTSVERVFIDESRPICLIVTTQFFTQSSLNNATLCHAPRRDNRGSGICDTGHCRWRHPLPRNTIFALTEKTIEESGEAQLRH